MTYPARILLAFLCLTPTASLITAQSNKPPAEVAPRKITSARKAAESAAAELAAKERRATAVSLLISLADDARNFSDPRLRARIQARIADVLWYADPEQGRTLFRKAWEAAEVADQESDQKLQEEIRQQKSRTGGGFALDLPPNLRREVLRLAASHERALGEELLEKLKARQEEAANAAANKRRSNTSLSEALSQRLGVAQELFLSGDIERALQFADPALGVISMETVNFLSNVRERNTAAADQRYRAMLASAASNMQSDANTVSLLSSYIFAPHTFIVFTPDGVSSSQMGSTVVAADVPPDLRGAFFQVAMGILFRPQLPPDQDQSTSGIEGRYLVLKHLLPVFEQYAPASMVEAVRGQLAALSTTVSESARQRGDDRARPSVLTETRARDQEKLLLERVDRAKTGAERDELFLQLAFNAMGSSDLRARDFVAKIDESELRKGAQAYVDAALATGAIGEKKTEQALELARIGELTHLQRAWVLTECAKLLAKTDREKSLELLEQAAAEARRIEPSDPGRPRALMAVASVFQPIDASRAWDAAFEAVKAANSAESFTGEDGELTLRFQAKGHSAVYSNNVANFDVAGIFAALAGEDYDRAVNLARGFQGPAPRATATIAIARSVLSKKQK